MPTGYTAPIVDGDISAYNFFSSIGRGMGYAIMQRDSGPGPVEYREVSTYYRDAAPKARQHYDEVKSRTEEQWQSLYKEYVLDTEARNRESEAKALAIRQNLNSVKNDLIAVRDFAPASMESTFNFAIDQIDQTLDFDGDPYIRGIDSYEQWRRQATIAARESVTYAEKGWADEQKRVSETNAMVDDFRATLELLRKA